MIRYTVTATVALVLALSGCASETTETQTSDFSAQVDKIFTGIDRNNAPGCSVGVIHQGSFLHKGGYGMANLELDIPLDENSVFRMASVSKQFTAMAVLLLAEEGKLDLDEDIRTYMPDLVDYGHKVTARAMIGHYAGMGDYNMLADSYEGPGVESELNLKSVAGGPYRLGKHDYLSNDEFYDVVKKAPLIQEPNTELIYSNFAYYLLSILVERQSGMSLRDYAEEKIFAPLGMDNTLFYDDGFEILKNRASGYVAREDGSYEIDMANLFVVGDGGLHTSVNDFIKWDQNFYVPKVGENPEAIIEQMNTPTTDLKFDDTPYANGQNVATVLGRRAFTHSGGWLGSSTYYMRFPDDEFSIVTLCNDTQQNPYDYVLEIAKLHFGEE